MKPEESLQCAAAEGYRQTTTCTCSVQRYKKRTSLMKQAQRDVQSCRRGARPRQAADSRNSQPWKQKLERAPSGGLRLATIIRVNTAGQALVCSQAQKCLTRPIKLLVSANKTHLSKIDFSCSAGKGTGARSCGVTEILIILISVVCWKNAPQSTLEKTIQKT